MSKYLIILFFVCGSCTTTRPSGDWNHSDIHYVNRHNHNFEIWLKNNKLQVGGLTSFKKEVNCPEECKW